MENKTLAVVALIVAVVALGITYFAPTKTQVTNVIKELGAIPGTEVSDNCFTIGGLTRCYYRRPFATATGTACAIVLPVGTSTLVSFNARLDSGTSTAGSLYLATSSNSYALDSVGSTATTSSIASMAVAGGTIPAFTVFGGSLSTGNNEDGLGGVTVISATSSINSVLFGTGTSSLVLFARGAGVGNDLNTAAPYTGYCTAEILMN